MSPDPFGITVIVPDTAVGLQLTQPLDPVISCIPGRFDAVEGIQRRETIPVMRMMTPFDSFLDLAVACG